jgi:hypothetical protein
MSEKKPPARLVIRHAGKMTKAGRKAIADWLRMHARMLEDEGDQYAPVFTGTYEAS